MVKAYDTSTSTVSGTAYITIPTTIREILAVNVDGEPVEFVTEEKLDQDAAKGIISTDWRNDSGTPEFCFIRGAYLYFYPIPNTTGDTVGISHKVNLTAMTDSASSYPLNTTERIKAAQLILVLYTVMDLAAEEGDSQQIAALEEQLRIVMGPIEKATKLAKRQDYPSKKEEFVQEDDQ